MINATSALLASTNGTTTTGSTDLGRDEFLKLLITQLRNQDPLSPLEPHEFAAQLAQFSSVEQLTQLNEEMAAQGQTLELNALLSKTSFSAALIGKQIVAEGNQVTIPSGSAGQVEFEVGAGGGSARLRLLDSAGNEVAARDLGTVAAGRQTVTLPGDLPAGTYKYEITVKDAKGASVPVVTYTTGTVDGVSFKDGSILLRLGKIEIAMDSLVEVSGAASTASTSP
jgi:flagellar basal-body rod modification protein FlgD